MSDYRFDTKVIHSGYEREPATHSVVPPIYATNAYVFDNAENAKKLFSLEEPGNIYSRLGNPTCDVLEKRIADLEGGAGALGFSSGHAAIFNTIINLCSQGDEIVSSANIYGGAINLLGVTLDRLGVKVTFVDPDDLGAWEKAVTPKTKMFFTEVVGNPNANVSDLSAIGEIAHKNGIPFVVDSTFTTPYLCRPIEFGADIVVHSATKYLSGHGSVMAGMVVDSGKFNFKNNPRFPLYNDPDPSYHGLVFADLGEAAFITRLRALVTRDLGACLSPFNAYITMLGVETLPIRMDRHCQNALFVAEFLEGQQEVESVSCPMLKSSKYHSLAQKYAPKGTGGVFTFELKGGREAGVKFMDSLKLLKIVANVGDVRSMVIHPATTTHSQLSSEQLRAGGITENTVRISIGLEDKQDIIEDLEQALKSTVK